MQYSIVDRDGQDMFTIISDQNTQEGVIRVKKVGPKLPVQCSHVLIAYDPTASNHKIPLCVYSYPLSKLNPFSIIIIFMKVLNPVHCQETLIPSGNLYKESLRLLKSRFSFSFLSQGHTFQSLCQLCKLESLSEKKTVRTYCIYRLRLKMTP